MDLSSGGGGLSLTQLFRNAEQPLMGPDQAGLQRLADLVRAQYRQSEQRERETQEKWTEDTETVETSVNTETKQWPDQVSPAAAAVTDPGSPAGSSSGSESGQSQSAGGREEKRRRL